MAMEEAEAVIDDEADRDDECVTDSDGGGGAIADSDIANGESAPPVARLRTLEWMIDGEDASLGANAVVSVDAAVAAAVRRVRDRRADLELDGGAF